MDVSPDMLIGDPQGFGAGAAFDDCYCQSGNPLARFQRYPIARDVGVGVLRHRWQGQKPHPGGHAKDALYISTGARIISRALIPKSLG